MQSLSSSSRPPSPISSQSKVSEQNLKDKEDSGEVEVLRDENETKIHEEGKEEEGVYENVEEEDLMEEGENVWIAQKSFEEEKEEEEVVVKNEEESTFPIFQPAFPPLSPHTSLPLFHHYRQAAENAPCMQWAGSYMVGQLVDYHSNTHKDWLPAKVINTGEGSMIAVDSKPAAWLTKEQQAWKVRPRGYVSWYYPSLTGLELYNLSKELKHVVRFRSPVIEDVKAVLLSYKAGDIRFDSRIAFSLMRHAVWVPKGREEKVNSLIACICAKSAALGSSASNQF